MTTFIKNPWFRKDSPYSSREYQVNESPIFEHRGVAVYRRARSWLYALGDTAITERAGFNKSAAPEIINSILDGKEPASDAVVFHLRANGHKALSWDEYETDYAAGRML